jgi:hypothetical protein
VAHYHRAAHLAPDVAADICYREAMGSESIGRRRMMRDAHSPSAIYRAVFART